MKLKVAVGIALVVFLVVVTATLTAGFILLEIKRIPGGSDKLNPQNLNESSATDSASTKTTTGLTLVEVAKHNTAADCWLVINNNVYAVSAYLNNHPGGTYVMIPFCGKEATNAFNTKGGEGQAHSELAKQLLSNFFVGKLGTSVQALQNGPSPTQNLKKNPNLVPAAQALDSPRTGSAVNLTSVEISSHNNAQNCWLIISGNVYNVTNYLSAHPGGVNVVVPFCGKEATNAFNTKGGSGSNHSNYANSLLNNYLIGKVGTQVAAAPQPTTLPSVLPTTLPTTSLTSAPTQSNLTLSTTEVASHNSTADCWIIISNSVYEVTRYLSVHPGGVNAISPFCGKEATQAFQTKGGRGSNHSSTAYNLLNNYKIGSVNGTVPLTTNPSPTTTTQSQGILPATLAEKYPGATIISQNNEDDGRMELKILFNGACRSIKLNANGEIVEDKNC